MPGGNKNSWFVQVRNLTTQYQLPDPLMILQSPPSKESWKSLCRSKVISFWEEKLRGQASLLPSLKYFLPAYMSLATTHPTWTMATTPYQVTKACTVASMLSGRYVTDYRARYWSHTNQEGNCQAYTLTGHPETPGTLEHLLVTCPALADTRTSANSFW